MEQLFLEMGFDKEDIEALVSMYCHVGKYKMETIIYILKDYGCSKAYIKDLIIHKVSVFEYDKDQLVYLLEAILSNGDLIEDTLTDIF